MYEEEILGRPNKKKMWLFVKDVGWKLLFDLNVFIRNGSNWNSEIAKNLLRYIVERNYSISLKRNYSSTKIRTLARQLAPAYGRFGGTPADFIIFSPEINSTSGRNGGVQGYETCRDGRCNWVPTSNYTLTGKLDLVYRSM